MNKNSDYLWRYLTFDRVAIFIGLMISAYSLRLSSDAIDQSLKVIDYQILQDNCSKLSESGISLLTANIEYYVIFKEGNENLRADGVLVAEKRTAALQKQSEFLSLQMRLNDGLSPKLQKYLGDASLQFRNVAQLIRSPDTTYADLQKNSVTSKLLLGLFTYACSDHTQSLGTP